MRDVLLCLSQHWLKFIFSNIWEMPMYIQDFIFAFKVNVVTKFYDKHANLIEM